MATATATAPTTGTTSLALAPPAPPRRPRVTLVGSALAAAASALTVLTLLGAYVAVRADLIGRGEPSLPEGIVMQNAPATMNMATLLMSLVTVAWAVYALRNRDRTHAYLALFLSLLLGVAFLVQTAYIYEDLGLGIADAPQGVLMFATAGAHVAMTVAGLLFLLVMGFRALGGQLTGPDAEGMSAATLYWYATVAVYAVLWYGIYITK